MAAFGSTAGVEHQVSKLAPGAYVQHGPFDLLAFAGQTVVVRFRATTDVSFFTTFRIDDVSVR